MSINVGDRIPEFNLINTDREFLSDKDFLGKKTSFVFIPFPFSSICDSEICALRDNFSNSNDSVQTVVITVCARPTNGTWADHYNLEYPILADFWPNFTQRSSSYSFYLRSSEARYGWAWPWLALPGSV